MMASIFFLWFIVALFAWFGFRRVSMILFVITLVVASVWFNHHVTTPLKIDL